MNLKDVLSFPYKTLSCAAQLMYLSGLRGVTKLPGVTISVGNLAVGGTGKSPVVVELANHLAGLGGRPVILTRGYRSGIKPHSFAEYRAGQLIASHRISSPVFPDEARMQSVALPDVPIVVSPTRGEAARWYLGRSEQAPTHWILDDGFQHWAIARDIDIVLVDAQRPFGNGMALPFGRLRELPVALKRADLVIITRANRQDQRQVAEREIRKFFQGQIAFCNFRTGYPMPPNGGPDDQRVLSTEDGILVATGIGNPQSFVDDLRQLGLNVKKTYVVSDHERLDVGILRESSRGCVAIVTTAKDYWREPDVFQQLPIATLISHLTVDSLTSVFSSIISSQK